jgi:hypothetical protein
LSFGNKGRTEKTTMSDANTILQRMGPRLLSDAEQRGYLQLLLRGAAPSAICVELGVPYSAVLLTLRECLEFRSDHDDAQMLLTENVAAALYRQAMKGSVPAMTLWLRNRPPFGWKDHEQSEGAADDYERMSDAELLELARAEGVAIPLAVARGFEAAGGEVLPG